MYGLGHLVDGFHSAFSHWGVLIILAKGVTPVPFKWLTIASGLERFSLAKFVIACAIARSAHYFSLRPF
jgi:membrane protein YqaA with SNARE-associated domain